MKIDFWKIIIPSLAIWMAATALFVSSFVGNSEREGFEPFYAGMLAPLVIMWLSGMIVLFGCWYDIFTAKNGTGWKLAWGAAILVLNLIGVVLYLIIGKNGRK